MNVSSIISKQSEVMCAKFGDFSSVLEIETIVFNLLGMANGGLTLQRFVAAAVEHDILKKRNQ